MHDANHGFYAKSRRVNKILSYLMEVIVASSLNWRMQHNILHHTYANIEGMNEDISLEFSPHAKRYRIYRAQYLYAWFLYGLMTIQWITSVDFVQLARYKRKDLIKTQHTTYPKALFNLILWKVLYYGYALILPMLVLDIAW